MKRLLKSIGPAIIVAAVVLGPGSILTSSKVGATFGMMGVPVVLVAAILMIAMVALSARLGLVYENSLCDELADRLGRSVAVAIGAILFTLIALFQSSNNLALIGGVEALLGKGGLSTAVQLGVLLVFNGCIVACLYLLRNLYRSVEGLMKILIGLMSIAFLINLFVSFSAPREFVPVEATEAPDLLPLLGMIGTTFSVAGAFYQAYLVKEKGWGLGDARKGLIDSTVSISVLGLMTVAILLTANRVFYGNPEPVVLGSVGDVALQLEPLFGSKARIVFAGGILAGALSSFLVNALIGGTVMSDSLGRGSRLDQPWPVHLTTTCLLVGMGVAMMALAREGSVVLLITIAQALTVLGIPALAAALIYLGTRPDLTGERKVPRWMLALACVGFLVACGLACLTAVKVYEKLAG
ncbi:MAG: manganese transporter [Verrucomicrobiales bacterium]|nr:manganese transporter [Verrucomicrobiales bacterium]|tara:strand:- start:7465 stop:8697 length:1233 start_codon:yes stop_codon:yes gene_type:complete